MASHPLVPHKINDKMFSLAFDKAEKRSKQSSNLHKSFLHGLSQTAVPDIRNRVAHPVPSPESLGSRAVWLPPFSLPLGLAGLTLRGVWQ